MSGIKVYWLKVARIFQYKKSKKNYEGQHIEILELWTL